MRPLIPNLFIAKSERTPPVARETMLRRPSVEASIEAVVWDIWVGKVRWR